MEAAEAAATCCHRADVSVKSEAIPSINMQTCETGLDGNGLMSMSEPVLASCSSCQPGNVDKSKKAKTERAIPPILEFHQQA